MPVSSSIRKSADIAGFGLQRTWPSVQRALAHRRLPPSLGLGGVLLTLGAITQGWAADDLIHRAMLLKAGLGEALARLFIFAEPATHAAAMEAGAIPWWAATTLRVAFYRPLASLTHWLDYSLFPDSAPLMHLHSALWYGLLCWAAALLYRQVIGATWIAGLAGLLFLVDIGHIGAVAWLANRNALMAAFFGLLAIHAHDRWRKRAQAGGSLLPALWLILSLLSSEAGLATCAYLFAYALFLERESSMRRWLTLMPYGLIVIVWFGAYSALGYGLAGSGFYTSPAEEMAAFVRAAIDRAPVLLAAQWVGIAPLLYNYLADGAARAVWVVGLLLSAGFLLLLLPLLRRDRTARFWALGMLLALAPACATRLLGGRLLLFAGVGALALIAHLAGEAFGRERKPPQSTSSGPWPLRIASVLLALHLPVALLLTPAAVTAPALLQQTVEQVLPLSIQSWTSTPTAGDRQVIVVNAPSPFHFLYLPALGQLAAEPAASEVFILAPGYATVTLTRLDEQTLLAQAVQGFFPSSDFGPRPVRATAGPIHPAYLYEDVASFVHATDQAMQVGETVEVNGLRVEVTQVSADGRPLESRVHFPRPLEDESFLWLQWSWETLSYEPHQVLPVGAMIELPGPL